MSKEIDRDELFERMRAAKTYANTARNPEHQEELELAAFMDIFHPRKEGYTLADIRKMRG